MWIFYIVEFTWYVCLHTQYKYYNIPFDSNIHVTVTVWTLQNLTNTNISLWTIWIQYSGCCGNRPKNPSSGGGTIAKGDKRGARPVGGPPSHLAIVQLTSVTSHCLTGTRAVETDCCVVHTAQQHPVTSQRDDKDSLWDISCNLSYTLRAVLSREVVGAHAGEAAWCVVTVASVSRVTWRLWTLVDIYIRERVKENQIICELSGIGLHWSALCNDNSWVF